MAKKDPESIEAGAGMLMSIVTSLNQAILKRTNGRPGALHHLTTPEGYPLIERMADIAAAGTTKTFTYEVDFDDPKWDVIDPARCSRLSNILASDYPRMFQGKKLVTVLLQEYNYAPYEQEVYYLANRWNEKLPDRAITETFGLKYPYELERGRVIGICGAGKKVNGEACSQIVELEVARVSLYWHMIRCRWQQPCRFLLVCKVEDVVLAS